MPTGIVDEPYGQPLERDMQTTGPVRFAADTSPQGGEATTFCNTSSARASDEGPPIETMAATKRKASEESSPPTFKRMKSTLSHRTSLDDERLTSDPSPDCSISDSVENFSAQRCVTLPSLSDPAKSMWTSTHDANAPSEDRHASLVNLFLKPRDHNDCLMAGDNHSMTTTSELRNCEVDRSEVDSKSLIRVSLWCVLDGHGGGCVAAYASEVLLPHIAASVSEALNCTVVSSGRFLVNGEPRELTDADLNALLLSSSDAVQELNPFSVEYRAPERANEDIVYYGRKEDVSDHDDSDVASDSDECNDYASSSSEDEQEDDEEEGVDCNTDGDHMPCTPPIVAEPIETKSIEVEAVASVVASSSDEDSSGGNESINERDSCRKEKPGRNARTGTHSALESAAISEAITRSFLAVDEGWINSIDSDNTQTSCIAGGRWNAGSCALVVCSVQRLDCDEMIFAPHQEVGGKNDDHVSHDMEGETTESEVASDSSSSVPGCALGSNPPGNRASSSNDRCATAPSVESGKNELSAFSLPTISYAHEAVMYTAHCGDCRAVLTTVAKKTKKKSRRSASSHLEGNDDIDSDDESDASSNSSDASDEDARDVGLLREYPYQKYMSRPPMRRCGYFGSSISRSRIIGQGSPWSAASSSSLSVRHSRASLPGQRMPDTTWQSIDLTLDHSAYNESEVELVLERCKNAPRAISVASSGGIKRVAGSLAVTRALGDAYLKTPELSFFPYKRHAPYISAQPEIKMFPIRKDDHSGLLSDRFLVLGSDGLWERASGDDTLRWIQSYFSHAPQQCERQERRFLPLRSRRMSQVSSPKSVSEFVVQRVLNKIRRAKKLNSIAALKALPKGRARRSKHDDITVSVIDLSGFVL